MIDINCDLGEGLHNEHIIMPLISSCNISCGAHAGSTKIIDKVIKLAVLHKVKIGAHPSFPDRQNLQTHAPKFGKISKAPTGCCSCQACTIVIILSENSTI